MSHLISLRVHNIFSFCSKTLSHWAQHPVNDFRLSKELLCSLAELIGKNGLEPGSFMSLECLLNEPVGRGGWTACALAKIMVAACISYISFFLSGSWRTSNEWNCRRIFMIIMATFINHLRPQPKLGVCYAMSGCLLFSSLNMISTLSSSRGASRRCSTISFPFFLGEGGGGGGSSLLVARLHLESITP